MSGFIDQSLIVCDPLHAEPLQGVKHARSELALAILRGGDLGGSQCIDHRPWRPEVVYELSCLFRPRVKEPLQEIGLSLLGGQFLGGSAGLGRGFAVDLLPDRQAKEQEGGVFRVPGGDDGDTEAKGRGTQRPVDGRGIEIAGDERPP